jgi:hypothetical protein
MRKPLIYNLPPLSVDVLDHIERLRLAAQFSLNMCEILGTKYLDHDRAAEVMSAYAIKDAEIRLEFYRNQPAFIDAWKNEIIERSVLAIMGAFPNFKYEVRGLLPADTLGPIYEDPRQFLDELLRVVTERLIPRPSTTVVIAAQGTDTQERRALFDQYRAPLPHFKMLDMCWAAQQHYSEWKRWLRGKLKNGSAPDRAFRALFQSKKLPSEYFKRPRPDGWK